MSQTLCVYITAGGREEAQRLARSLVEERLAACVNLLGPVLSVYRWQEAVEEAEEFVLIVKTAAERFAALEQRVRALHSYEVPCIVAWPHGGGYPPFLDWIRSGSTPAM